MVYKLLHIFLYEQFCNKQTSVEYFTDPNRKKWKEEKCKLIDPMVIIFLKFKENVDYISIYVMIILNLFSFPLGKSNQKLITPAQKLNIT